MCIWDQLQMRARHTQPRAYVEVSDAMPVPQRNDLLEKWYAETYRVGAQLSVEVSVANCMMQAPNAEALILRSARESLARLLYEDVIEQVLAIQRAVIDEKREHALCQCERLLRYMTDDSARPQTEQDCHATS